MFGTVAFSVVMSVLFLVTRGSDSMYDEIGKGGLSKESDYSGVGATGSPELDTPAGRSEQEQEVRQMLRARSDRRVQRGEPALDIDAEVARLLGDADRAAERDPALVAEVRQLVEARNERRSAPGQGGVGRRSRGGPHAGRAAGVRRPRATPSAWGINAR